MCIYCLDSRRGVGGYGVLAGQIGWRISGNEGQLLVCRNPKERPGALKGLGDDDFPGEGSDEDGEGWRAGWVMRERELWIKMSKNGSEGK